MGRFDYSLMEVDVNVAKGSVAYAKFIIDKFWNEITIAYGRQ